MQAGHPRSLGCVPRWLQSAIGSQTSSYVRIRSGRSWGFATAYSGVSKYSSNVFGARNAGTIYGAMLTAWSAGAGVGPLLIAAVPYRTALPLIATMLAVAAILPVIFNALARRSDLAGARAPALRPQRIAIGR